MTTPEARARSFIDRLLTAAGWVVQDSADLNLTTGLGVAIREFSIWSVRWRRIAPVRLSRWRLALARPSPLSVVSIA